MIEVEVKAKVEDFKPIKKILIELLSGQNAIKDSIKEIINKTNELFENNKSIYENKEILDVINHVKKNNSNLHGTTDYNGDWDDGGIDYILK